MVNGLSNDKLYIFDATNDLNEKLEIPKTKGKSPGPLDEHTA